MYTFAYDYGTYYQVIVTDGTEDNSFAYPYVIDQDIEVSILEATRLAEDEVARKQPVIPVSI